MANSLSDQPKGRELGLGLCLQNTLADIKTLHSSRLSPGGTNRRTAPAQLSALHVIEMGDAPTFLNHACNHLWEAESELQQVDVDIALVQYAGHYQQVPDLLVLSLARHVGL